MTRFIIKCWWIIQSRKLFFPLPDSVSISKTLVSGGNHGCNCDLTMLCSLAGPCVVHDLKVQANSSHGEILASFVQGTRLAWLDVWKLLVTVLNTGHFLDCLLPPQLPPHPCSDLSGPVECFKISSPDLCGSRSQLTNANMGTIFNGTHSYRSIANPSPASASTVEVITSALLTSVMLDPASISSSCDLLAGECFCVCHGAYRGQGINVDSLLLGLSGLKCLTPLQSVPLMAFWLGEASWTPFSSH